MTVIRCDLCGCTTPRKVVVELLAAHRGQESFDLCDKCATRLIEFLKTMPYAPDTTES
jgi:hypothetical protein